MFRTIDRYVFKEALQAWFSVTGILLFILLSNQFARVLGDAAKDKIPKDAVFQVIGLTATQYLTIIGPFGLFLAIMLAMARLYRDSEMPAMMALRIGPATLYRPLAWLVLPLAGLVGYLALVTGPHAILAVERITAEAGRNVDLAALEPGRFVETGSSGAVIYAESIQEDGSLVNVFVERRAEAGGVVEVVVAERGFQTEASEDDHRFIVLQNGRRYEGVPGTHEFRLIEFKEHGLPFAIRAAAEVELEPESRSVSDLLADGSPAAIAELQWRISIPLSVIVLAFLAVPLSRSQPRQGRYGKLAIGVLIYIIYFNLLGAAKVWVEQEKIPAYVGMWWVHAAVVLLGVGVYAIHNGWLAGFRRSRP